MIDFDEKLLYLPIKGLSRQATATSIFENLHSPLISKGQLCDDNCIVHVDKHKIKVSKNNKLILRGHRSKSGDGLWDNPIPTPPSRRYQPPSIPQFPRQSSNVVLRHDKSRSDLAQYLHAALFSPTQATLLRAIKSNFLISFPNLTAKLIEKHPPPSVFTTAGHLRQEKQGLRSTKATFTSNQCSTN